MTDTTSIALQTSLAFYHAWTGGDFDLAMTHIADGIVCDTPAGQVAGAEAFRGFLEPFSRILTSSALIAAFGDDQTALLMYDTDTVPVKNAPGAECHSVVDGKITRIRIIFDRTPFDAARAAAAAGRDQEAT